MGLFSPLLLGNYTKLAFRHLRKHRAYCAIHIAGLAVGLTCLISIGLFVEHELRYDQFQEKRDRIFRILREIRVTDQHPLISTTTSGPLAPTLQNDFPEVEQAVRVWIRNDIWVQHEKKGFFESFCLADPHLFDVFTFPLIKGNPKTVLQNPASIVISHRLAQKYFGNEDPIGKVIEASGGYFNGEYQITGIMKNIPHHPTLQHPHSRSRVAKSRRCQPVTTICLSHSTRSGHLPHKRAVSPNNCSEHHQLSGHQSSKSKSHRLFAI